MGSVYTYIDGESHYVRVQETLLERYGNHATLDAIKSVRGSDGTGYQHWHKSAAKFYWDDVFHRRRVTRFREYEFRRNIYFTSFTGTDDELHVARKYIRKAGFEPQVVSELKDKRKQRDNALKNQSILEKAKGVDVALAVRMLEDAYHGNYEACVLLTSDIDYLPVIEAVRRMGKVVFVVGFGQGIGKNSPFHFVPDCFIDYGALMVQLEFEFAQ